MTKKIGHMNPKLLTEEEEIIWTIIVYVVGLAVGTIIGVFLL